MLRYMMISLLIAVLYTQRWAFEESHAVERSDWYDSALFFRNKQGLLVHYRQTGRPAEVRGAVVVVHGFAEHHGYYEELARRLERQGLAVFALDHAGHGRSEGERQYVQSIDHLVDDVIFLANLVRHSLLPRQSASVPLFLYGHSMGGMASIKTAMRDNGHLFTTTVLESPLVQIHPRSGAPWQIWLGRILGRLVPKIKVPSSQLDRNLLTRSQELRELWDKDTLIKPSDLFAGTGAAFIQAADEIQQSPANFSFFLATGTDDFACDPQAGVKFYEAATTPAHLKQLKLYPGGYHTMKHDPISEEFFNDVAAWYEKFLPPRAGAAKASA